MCADDMAHKQEGYHQPECQLHDVPCADPPGIDAEELANAQKPMHCCCQQQD